MKCKDCGKRDYQPSSRYDICVNCMELRVAFISASPAMGMDKFRVVQRALARGNGKGANAIRRALGLAAPEI